MGNASLEYIDQLIQQIFRHTDPLEHQAFSLFSRLFLRHLSVETLTSLSEATWNAFLTRAWHFYKVRSAQHEAQVKCVLVDVESAAGLFQGTCLLILNTNVPFLVSSLQNFLSHEQKLDVSLLCHPVFDAKRDAQGRLLHLAPVNTTSQGIDEESFIFCLLNEPLTPSRTLELQEGLQKLFRRVTCMVGDWSEMRKQAHALAVSLGDGENLQEVAAFLSWLDGEHFTFLGHSRHLVSPEGEVSLDAATPSLGLLRDAPRDWPSLLFDGIQQTRMRHLLTEAASRLLITKTSQKSPVLRSEFMDAIGFKVLDSAGRVVALHHFLGFFTARAYTQSARDIPLVRLKVKQALEKSGLGASWHDGKRLIHILETLPRDELFQSSAQDLWSLGALGLEFDPAGPVRLSVRFDLFGRYVSCFVFVPRERYRAELRYQMGDYLASFFEGSLVKHHVHLESLPFAWMHYLIHLPKPSLSKEAPLGFLEKELTTLSVTWMDRLQKAWIRSFGEKQGSALYQESRHAFPKAYEGYCTPEEATQDFHEMQKACAEGQLHLVLKGCPENSGLISLKIYSPNAPILLSDVIPALHNMGLTVLTEIPFEMKVLPDATSWLHIIKAQIDPAIVLDTQACALFVESFRKVWAHEVENDGLNRLVLAAGLNWRECVVLRAYAKYLKQIQITYSQGYIEEVLLRHREILKSLVRLFILRFDPLVAAQRESFQEVELHNLKILLSQVTHPNDERVLRCFANLILATLRTNFYQRLADGSFKSYLSFKFDCHHLDGLPIPLPLYEIFVYSPRVEGLHLRGGKVARGGIRWSDRHEDYRTEVLDLMKTQMIKNAVTVPVGSKGAFVVKTQGLSPEKLREEGVLCYDTFIRGLLDLTDNRVKGDIVHPDAILPWDGPDPYLVVAADKGTSDFSNEANTLAEEYAFWLGDAFASGGSYGYNHKEMAITSRGAWESVKHHFKQIGLDAQNTPFTVVGVGDMSGDVFGNGMLLSDKIQLIGAFDHRHIFLDPNPDVTKSYAERKRLFQLKQSSWNDYDREALSAGGGVFSRDSRTISLSSEIRARLGTTEETLPPDELIKLLLRAPVDLLWLAGIGTFVKASTESHTEVADKTNDAFRVDGQDLRARVVVEGANLGFTQRGRIEYALSGGHINTDALDNSAGVDCSDHEVNLKLLFGELLTQGAMTLEERNHLLEAMRDEVAALVLVDNYWQNQAVALAYAKGSQLLEEHGRLIRALEVQGLLDRSLEALPTEAMLQQRKALKLGLTRPELCVLLAYSKIVLYQNLADSDLLLDPQIEKVLYKYFPKVVTENFQQACKAHPLRREIIATVVTNIVVNTRGPSFVNEVCELTGAQPDRVVKSLWIVRKVLCLGDLEEAYLQLKSPLLQQHTLWFIDGVVKRLVIWFLTQEDLAHPIQEVVDRYRPGFDALRKNTLNFLPKSYAETLQHSLHMFFEGEEEAQRIGAILFTYEPLSVIPDIIRIHQCLNKPLMEVARLYYALGEFLGLRWAQSATGELPQETPWQKKALREIREQMLLLQHQLTQYLFASYPLQHFHPEQVLALWHKDHHVLLEQYLQIFADLQKHPLGDLAPLVVLERELERLYEKTAGMCTMTVSY